MKTIDMGVRMKAYLKKRTLLIVAAICGLMIVVLLITFGRSKTKGTAKAPPLDVEVVVVKQKDVPIYSEWIGTLDGMVNAEIRAQVSGYLLSKNYTEGSFVRKGQSLFEIDPRPLQAALDQAKGDLAKAQAQLTQANGQLLQSQAQLAQSEANQGKAQLDVNRYTPLARQKAITDQELDNAIQSNLAAQAQVKASSAGVETAKAAIVAAKAAVTAAEAAVQTAQLNLGFTKLTSPIDGVAGIAQAQVGNLVSPTSGLLTTVSTLDPIKVYFTPTEREYLNFNRANPTQSELEAARNKLELELVLVDGSVYPQKGRFYVRDRQVDQKTGAIKVAGLFPNPGALLRPGQYGRVRAVINVRKDALLVPQRAVSELQGSYRVAVVGGDNKVNIRAVTVGERVGSMWIVESGLSPGERVVAEGTQRVRPDAVVDPKPYVEAPPTPAPAR